MGEEREKGNRVGGDDPPGFGQAKTLEAAAPSPSLCDRDHGGGGGFKKAGGGGGSSAGRTDGSERAGGRAGRNACATFGSPRLGSGGPSKPIAAGQRCTHTA